MNDYNDTLLCKGRRHTPWRAVPGEVLVVYPSGWWYAFKEPEDRTRFIEWACITFGAKYARWDGDTALLFASVCE